MKSPAVEPGRRYLRCIVAAIWLSLGCSGWYGQTRAQDATERPAATLSTATRQFLVLKTGSVYSGQLEFGGGKYIVHRHNGSSVRFRHGEVDFVTDSLEDAYRRLEARLAVEDVIGHQSLARWCLKYRQLENARRQLERLRQMPGGHKSIRTLERQLQVLASPRPEQIPLETAATEMETGPGIRRLPRTETSMASREELKSTIDSFSRESLRDFNRSVHLRIVNGCTAARCHGDAENPLRLWRVDDGIGMASTGVQRNLHAIAQYIDRQNPEQSVLLRYISGIHADMDAPPYDPQSHHFHAIRDWVLGTGIRTAESKPAEEDSRISRTRFEDPPMPAADAPQELPEMQGELIPAPVDLSRNEPRFVARDEFDPAIFNRVYADPPSGGSPMTPPRDRIVELPEPPRPAPPPPRNTRALPPVDQTPPGADGQDR
jgi:hypothetical protein